MRQKEKDKGLQERGRSRHLEGDAAAAVCVCLWPAGCALVMCLCPDLVYSISNSSSSSCSSPAAAVVDDAAGALSFSSGIGCALSVVTPRLKDTHNTQFSAVARNASQQVAHGMGRANPDRQARSAR